MKALALTLLVFTLGCGKPALGMSYDVLLDSGLSTEQAEAAITGGYAWQAKIPGLKLNFVMMSCGAYQDNLLGTICVHSSPSSPRDDAGDKVDGHTNSSSDDDRADVTLYPTNYENGGHPFQNALLNIVTHELGHALAYRGDHIQSGNLMSFEIVDSSTPEAITQADIDYFWSNR